MRKILKAAKYSLIVELSYLLVWVLLITFAEVIAPNAIPSEAFSVITPILAGLISLVVLASLILLIIGCYRNKLAFLRTLVLIYIFLFTHIYAGFMMICWDEGPVFYGLSHLWDFLILSVPCILVASVIAGVSWGVSQALSRKPAGESL